jgi:hypothetical protein
MGSSDWSLSQNKFHLNYSSCCQYFFYIITYSSTLSKTCTKNIFQSKFEKNVSLKITNNKFTIGRKVYWNLIFFLIFQSTSEKSTSNIEVINRIFTDLHIQYTACAHCISSRKLPKEKLKYLYFTSTAP